MNEEYYVRDGKLLLTIVFHIFFSETRHKNTYELEHSRILLENSSVEKTNTYYKT